jgi:pyrroloquinoline quinone biosynthesis protein E
VLLDERLMTSLVDAGLEHVQLSFQDTVATNADRIAGLDHAHERKLRAAAIVKAGGLPLTLNFVVHRQNLDRLEAMLALAVELGAGRIEIAHVQYYGWALANRAAFLPSRAQLDAANAVVDAARERLRGVLAIDYVPPDYYAHRPKACMAGWGRRFLNITPSGKVLPCHAAETLTGIEFPSVRDLPLAEIWHDAPAFQLYRGTDWMAEPCRSCDRREIYWGGCRCQAFALTGDAGRTDPACALSPDHALLDVALVEAEAAPGPFTYRRIGAASLAAR